MSTTQMLGADSKAPKFIRNSSIRQLFHKCSAIFSKGPQEWPTKLSAKLTRYWQRYGVRKDSLDQSAVLENFAKITFVRPNGDII